MDIRIQKASRMEAGDLHKSYAHMGVVVQREFFPTKFYVVA
jgi:hypothetical protein